MLTGLIETKQHFLEALDPPFPKEQLLVCAGVAPAPTAARHGCRRHAAPNHAERGRRSRWPVVNIVVVVVIVIVVIVATRCLIKGQLSTQLFHLLLGLCQKPF
jgi:hypothetical protein